MYRVSTSLLMIWVLMNLTVVAPQERAATRPSSPGGPKQALVVGNSAYTHTSPLKNPVNDAKAIGSALQQLGFEVTTLLDVDQRQMEQALRRFGSRLRDQNGVGLFYYAGHGMQVAGENYLLPVDINPSTETDVRYDAIPVGKLLGQMEAAGNGMNIVILDACRNNPFSRSFRSNSRGLAQVIAPTGSFISYATAPGNVAADGEGDNGLFTAKLLEHMKTPGLKLEEVFKRVRSDVQRESNDQQVPWDSSSLTGDFFFVPMEAEELAAPAESVFEESSEQDFATEAWELVKDSEDPALLEGFIAMFPDAPQLNLAKLKLMTLKSSSSPDLLLNNSPSGETAKKRLLETKECAGCNLDKVDLREVDLRGADMRNVSLTKAYLWKANLEGANLEGANLQYTNLELANLEGANLKNTNLKNARLVETKLTRANLLNANISNIQIFKTEFCETIMPDGSIKNSYCPEGSYQSYTEQDTNVVLSGEEAKKKLFGDNECVGCNLNGTSLSGNILRGANLTKATLRGADLRGADLHEAKLRESDLRGADLQRADLQGADLSYSEMPYADLNEADLQGADLFGANLKNAKFCKTTMPDGSIANRDCYPAQVDTNQSSTVLSGEAAKKKLLETKECVGCDLNGTNLQRSNLTSANLQRANLRDANLYQANLGYAQLMNTNLRRANLREADLFKIYLMGSNLSGADLRETDLREADLTGADLREANLTESDLTEAKPSWCYSRESHILQNHDA